MICVHCICNVNDNNQRRHTRTRTACAENADSHTYKHMHIPIFIYICTHIASSLNCMLQTLSYQIVNGSFIQFEWLPAYAYMCICVRLCAAVRLTCTILTFRLRAVTQSLAIIAVILMVVASIVVVSTVVLWLLLPQHPWLVSLSCCMYNLTQFTFMQTQGTVDTYMHLYIYRCLYMYICMRLCACACINFFNSKAIFFIEIAFRSIKCQRRNTAQQQHWDATNKQTVDFYVCVCVCAPVFASTIRIYYLFIFIILARKRCGAPNRLQYA